MTGRRPQGEGTGSAATWEQDTTHGPEREGTETEAQRKRDTTTGNWAHKQEGHVTTEGPTPPHPQPTPHDPRRRTPPTHAAETRMGRRTDHTGSRPPATRNHRGEARHTCTGRKRYTHRGSRREHRRAAHHHALTARRRPRPQQGPPHRHRKRKKERPQHPGLEARTPRGHGTTAQAPREGNPADT